MLGKKLQFQLNLVRNWTKNYLKLGMNFAQISRATCVSTNVWPKRGTFQFLKIRLSKIRVSFHTH